MTSGSIVIALKRRQALRIIIEASNEYMELETISDSTGCLRLDVSGLRRSQIGFRQQHMNALVAVDKLGDAKIAGERAKHVGLVT